ncbi:MAG: hypothetical protein JW910_02820, partial [Anaerolineae bacterium]|nr:hypothetical protein [Anaerolineae bacterium]
MVPHTNVAAAMQAQGQTIFDRIPALTAASFGPGPRMNLPIGDDSAPADPFRALAILVDFSDNVQQVSATYFDTLLYDMTPGASTVANFYLENSYGELDIVALDLPSTLGWQRAAHDYG